MAWKSVNSVDYLVVHCSATSPSQDIGANEIRQWHQSKGWLDIGYHWVIRRDGTLETGRPVGTRGAHAKGFNHISQSICLVGGVNSEGDSEDNFTDAQMLTLHSLLKVLTHYHPEAEVLGHRDLPGVAKDCPCFDVPEWWDWCMK